MASQSLESSLGMLMASPLDRLEITLISNSYILCCHGLSEIYVLYKD